MKTFIRLVALFSVFILVCAFFSCGGDFEPDYEMIGCRVIKIEPCSTDTLCLLVADIPYPSNKRLYDDTLTVDGVLGEKLRIEFNVSNSQANECTGKEAYQVPEVKILDVALANYSF